MTKTFISGILAASLTLTSIGAAPAYADGRNDLRNILTGLAIIAIIGAAIDQNNGRGNGSATVNRPSYGGNAIPRNQRRLPTRCFRQANTRNGPLNFFGRGCLQNNYRFTRLLPQRCEITVRTRNGNRQGYLARCLRRAGYEFRRN